MSRWEKSKGLSRETLAENKNAKTPQSQLLSCFGTWIISGDGGESVQPTSSRGKPRLSMCSSRSQCSRCARTSGCAPGPIESKMSMRFPTKLMQAQYQCMCWLIGMIILSHSNTLTCCVQRFTS